MPASLWVRSTPSCQVRMRLAIWRNAPRDMTRDRPVSTSNASTRSFAVQPPALDPGARPDADNAQALLGLSGGTTAAVSLGRHYPGGDLVTIEVFGSAGHERLTVLAPDDGECMPGQVTAEGVIVVLGSYAILIGVAAF